MKRRDEGDQKRQYTTGRTRRTCGTTSDDINAQPRRSKKGPQLGPAVDGLARVGCTPSADGRRQILWDQRGALEDSKAHHHHQDLGASQSPRVVVDSQYSLVDRVEL